VTAPLKLQSERYPPEGGAGGDAARRALGKPKLDPLSVLIRESVQNSWDARCKPENKKSSISFTASLDVCDDRAFKALAENVFAETPSGGHPLRRCLRRGMTRLILEDRNTVGLGGPVFKDEKGSPTEPRHFIRFFRDIGRAAHSSTGGGTYGYGKSVFFNASAASTVVVRTRFRTAAGRFENRLMAMSLWSASEDEVFTGRHWWGVPSPRRNLVAPLVGADCERIADRLGFRPFEADETGSGFMIVAPKLALSPEETLEAVARRIGETMVVWYWPRMLGGFDRAGKISFRVFSNGTDVPVPDPRQSVPFDIYARALSNLQKKRSDDASPETPDLVEEIRSERPKARLGWLSLSLASRRARPAWEIANDSELPVLEQLKDESGDPPVSRHVALVRSPGQVIRYLPTSVYPNAQLEYGGIFILDTDSDAVQDEFIESEPPSHDDWVAPERGSQGRSVVRIGKRRIAEAAERFAESGRIPIVGGPQDPLGEVSADLGQLLSAEGTGARPEVNGRPRGKGGRRGPRVQLLDDGRLEERSGRKVFVLTFQVESEIPESGLRIIAKPKVIVAGGAAENEAPANATTPKVLGWRKTGNDADERSAEILDLASADAGTWEVAVSIPPDAVVGVSLSAEER
jgi:hypothetical protein